MKRMRTRGLVVLCLIVAFVVSACATTPLGKAYQSAGVLVTANTQAQNECERSKIQGRLQADAIEQVDPGKASELRANGIPPFTKSVCQNLALAYSLAKEAAKKALQLTSQGQPTAAQYAAAGISYIYTVTSLLSQAGVRPAGEIQDFLDQTSALLLRPTATEVR